MATPALARDATSTKSSPNEPVAGHSARFVSLSCGLAAALIAAGSTGLIGHTLRHALTFVLLGATLVTGLPARSQSILARSSPWRFLAALAGVVIGALLLLRSPAPPNNVMAVAVVLAALAWLRPPAQQSPFLAAAAAVLVLGLWRYALLSLPWLWLIADHLGQALSTAAGVLSLQPLRTGATYAGLDFLVVSSVLAALRFRRNSTRQNIRIIVAILAVHLLYLAALSYAPKILASLPATKVEAVFGQKANWDWAQAIRTLLPWNVPALALLLHLAFAVWLFRTWPLAAVTSTAGDARSTPRSASRIPAWALAGAPIVLALVLPVVTSLNSQTLSLANKKIVVHEKGFLNWMKPKHGEYGRLSVGMYGMLPEFLQNYGATCLVSPELSAADLQGAQLLILIFPNKPWAPGQLDRIWNFVREGGSLLVLGEHTVREKEGGSRFNDVLEPTSLRIAFDSSMFEVGGWLESYEALSHPATAGLEDYRNEFGVVIGASVSARWPARPVLAGRFGFSDPGDVTNDESKGGSMMGNHKYDAGEKLGDQVLAAEQRFGRGRVMAFGDTSGFSNSILYGSHDFVARLFAYLCNDAGSASVRTWIGGAGLLVLAGILFGFGLHLRPSGVAGTGIALAIGLTWTTVQNYRAASVLPDGRPAPSTPPNNTLTTLNPPAANSLAYIDLAHLARSSGESWREEGVGGLEMTLMRSGYVVLGLDEFDPARLERAGLFIAVAPSKPYSASEISTIRRYVENGGIFLCTVGWPEASASRALLAELGFYVGGIGAATTGQPEPKPFGHFKAPFFNGGTYMAYVRFNAAWHVESPDREARPLAYGPRAPNALDQPDPSVILMRRIGRGKAVVIADTEFATNKNLEREGGQPFEGMRENADFWRWMLDYLNDRQPWTPPKPIPFLPVPTNTVTFNPEPPSP